MFGDDDVWTPLKTSDFIHLGECGRACCLHEQALRECGLLAPGVFVGRSTVSFVECFFFGGSVWRSSDVTHDHATDPLLRSVSAGLTASYQVFVLVVVAHLWVCRKWPPYIPRFVRVRACAGWLHLSRLF